MGMSNAQTPPQPTALSDVLMTVSPSLLQTEAPSSSTSNVQNGQGSPAMQATSKFHINVSMHVHIVGSVHSRWLLTQCLSWAWPIAGEATIFLRSRVATGLGSPCVRAQGARGYPDHAVDVALS